MIGLTVMMIVNGNSYVNSNFSADFIQFLQSNRLNTKSFFLPKIFIKMSLDSVKESESEECGSGCQRVRGAKSQVIIQGCRE